MLNHSAEKISKLKNIDLWESYVLGWERADGTLSIKIDAVLLPNHEVYTKPTPEMWACYKKGKLQFKGVSSLEGYHELKSDRAATDASGEKDYGHIEEFKFTKLGDYYFEIEFAGPLKFKAKEIDFVLTNV
ncbi:hypothetical protein [Marinomonas posidonica]|uniref:Uncharacterized protein n=1 Tax=Marinomonas posidonica (strain CECT 7376 / NCIMB 14433 / IVIA-Po-181) TaxID=491952 RepID=F6CYI1_MARPP|nr:hypothetical protein [Marinomonas posidonica]AEF54590.1 hypothetical protein Mar181_1549 [Marinomonas posidonica IVIA-Po-181]